MRRQDRARRALAVSLAAALAAVLAACAPEATATVTLPDQVSASLDADTQTQLQDAVEAAMAASGSTGAIAGVWVPWAGTWLQGLGTGGAGGAKTTADMTFKANASTRTMTCDVLYALVHEGTVQLDDPVTDYVPGLPGYEDITLEQLCDSTSGIAGYASAISWRWRANPTRVWNPRELMAYGLGKPATGAAGVSFSDSDTGYVMLGQALEHATGKSAAELYDEYVFTPTGMTSSALPDTSTVQLQGLYTRDVDGKISCDTSEASNLTSLSPSAGYTAEGVTTNLTDLGRYTQAVATGARDFDAKGRFDDGLPAAKDAASWFTATGGAYQAGTLIGQFGSVPGYLTAAFADRDTGMTIVVVLNNSRGPSYLARSLAWELAAIASKAPAASGQTAPDAGLPWTAADMAAQVESYAICPTS